MIVRYVVMSQVAYMDPAFMLARSKNEFYVDNKQNDTEYLLAILTTRLTLTLFLLFHFLLLVLLLL